MPSNEDGNTFVNKTNPNESTPPIKVEVNEINSKYTKKAKIEDPPLVSLKVTNPVTFIKLWWKKIMSKEGVDLRIKIHPVTTVLIVLVILSLGFGLGKIDFPNHLPFVYYPLQSPSPTPTLDPWKETALSGILRFTQTTGKYYLETPATEAITLQFPYGIDLSKYVGKRILVSGNYNKSTRALVVKDVLDLELLPLVPQLIATPTPPVISSTPTPTPSPEVTPVVSTEPSGY